MPTHSHTVEQIISELREAEVLISQGQTIPAAPLPEDGGWLAR